MEITAKDLVREVVAKEGIRLQLQIPLGQVKDLSLEAAKMLLSVQKLQAHSVARPAKDHIAQYFLNVQSILHQAGSDMRPEVKVLHEDALMLLGAVYTENENVGLSVVSPGVLGTVAGMLAQSIVLLTDHTGEDPVVLLERL